jgi:hypothetical protein
VECLGDVPTASTLPASDNCDSSVAVATASDSPPSGDPCGTQTITRTWTASDCSGNSSSVSQLITVVDTTPPIISCPEDVQLGAEDSTDPASTGSATAVDLCDADPIVTYSDSVAVNPCGLDTITRTWIATDCSNNSASCEQIITVWCLDQPAQLSVEGFSAPNTLHLKIEGVQGSIWEILTSPDMENGTWSRLTTIEMDAEVKFYDDTNFSGVKFYRLTRVFQPVFLSIRRLSPSDTMRLTLEGVRGYTWDVLVSPDMKEGTWSKLTTIEMDADTKIYDDTTFSDKQFYRLSTPE